MSKAAVSALVFGGLLVLVFAPATARLAAAQGGGAGAPVVDMTQPVGHRTVAGPPVLGAPGAGRAVTVLDDFNRADGPIGPNWTNQAATFNVVSNAAQGGSMAIATFNGVASSWLEGDVATNGTTTQYTGFVLDYGAGITNLFLKVQDNSGSGQFSNAACYTGNNSGSFGLGFFSLTAPFSTAHMRVSVDAGRTVTIEFTNIDGGGTTQTYTCTGAPPPEGTGIGIVGYASIERFDNFAADVIPVELQSLDVD